RKRLEMLFVAVYHAVQTILLIAQRPDRRGIVVLKPILQSTQATIPIELRADDCVELLLLFLIAFCCCPVDQGVDPSFEREVWPIRRYVAQAMQFLLGLSQLALRR